MTPADDLAAVAAATTRLLDDLAKLRDEDVAGPSGLPGWTRGHVLAHIARNADSLVNLLLWARTGIETPQYASKFMRDADIEAGASRPLSEQADDIATAAQRFGGLAATAPAESWEVRVKFRNGREVPARRVVWSRLQEVEIHHVDLAAGYTPADWPMAFTTRLLHEVVGDYANLEPSLRFRTPDGGGALGRGEPADLVSGSSAAVLAWLIGRSDGADLEASQPLPKLPPWK